MPVIDTNDITPDFVFEFIVSNGNKDFLAFWKEGLPIIEPEELAVMLQEFYTGIFSDPEEYGERRALAADLKTALPVLDWLAVVNLFRARYCN